LCADVVELLSLPFDDAMLLMQACSWKKNVVEEAWFDDPEKVREKENINSFWGQSI
jgi:hypothetical protein